MSRIKVIFAVLCLVFLVVFSTGQGILNNLPAQNSENTANPPAPAVLGKVGLGMGIPYGGFGLGGEVGSQHFSILGGIGTLIFGSGWSIGGRAYALSSDHTWRPHFTLVYGTTVVYSITGAYEAEGTLKGVAGYVGVDQDIGNIGGFGATYSIGLISHGDLPNDVKDNLERYNSEEPDFGSPVKINVGLNYRFGG